MIGTYRIQAGPTIFNVGGDGKRPSTYPVLNLDGGNPGRKRGKHYQEARAKLAQATGDPTVDAFAPDPEAYNTQVHKDLRTAIVNAYTKYRAIRRRPYNGAEETVSVEEMGREIGAISALNLLSKDAEELSKLVSEAAKVQAARRQQQGSGTILENLRSAVVNSGMALAGTHPMSHVIGGLGAADAMHGVSKAQAQHNEAADNIASALIDNAVAAAHYNAIETGLQFDANLRADGEDSLGLLSPGERAQYEEQSKKYMARASQTWGEIGTVINPRTAADQTPLIAEAFGVATATADQAMMRMSVAQFPKVGATVVAGMPIIQYGLIKAVSIFDPEAGKKAKLPPTLSAFARDASEIASTFVLELAANRSVAAAGNFGAAGSMVNNLTKKADDLARAGKAGGWFRRVGSKMTINPKVWASRVFNPSALTVGVAYETLKPALERGATELFETLWGVDDEHSDINFRNSAYNAEMRALNRPNRRWFNRLYDFAASAGNYDEIRAWFDSDVRAELRRGAAEARNKFQTQQSQEEYGKLVTILHDEYKVDPGTAHELAVGYRTARNLGRDADTVHESLMRDENYRAFVEENPVFARANSELISLFNQAKMPPAVQQRILSDPSKLLAIFEPHERPRFHGLRGVQDAVIKERGAAANKERTKLYADSRKADQEALAETRKSTEARERQMAGPYAGRTKMRPLVVPAQGMDNPQVAAEQRKIEQQQAELDARRKAVAGASTPQPQAAKPELASWQDRYRKRINEFDKRRYDGQNDVDDNMAWKPVEPIGQPKVGSYRLGGRYSG